MAKVQIVRRPTKIRDLPFDDLQYEEVYDDWRKRAERLQARRWHLLQQAQHAARKA